MSHYSHLNSLPSAFAYLDLHNVHRPTVVLLDKFSVMLCVRNKCEVSLGNISVADSMGLSSFTFLWWALKDMFLM